MATLNEIEQMATLNEFEQTLLQHDDNLQGENWFGMSRREVSLSQYYFNYTSSEDYSYGDDFTPSLNPATDVSVHAVLTSIYLNLIAFFVLMASYECLRRILPAVYSSEMKRQFKTGLATSDSDTTDDYDADSTTAQLGRSYSQSSQSNNWGVESTNSSMASLPDIVSCNWVTSVISVSWEQVRKSAGLDGYFFLRYIRMNVRICAVTTFWALAILVPIYSTGYYQNGGEGWYHISVANVAPGSWRMWVACCFAYLMSGFIFFVMKQEYRHFLELRMDFLARGSSHVHPQHHYSLMIENIPYDLRSEKALYDYFDKLFPDKVHSATVVLNLPDLEAVKARCLRICRRLEKSIAYYHATGKRATHNVGSPRMNILGIDLAPCDWSLGSYPEITYKENYRVRNEKPQRGTHVDSISYYTHDLAACNKDMYFMQQRKAQIAVTGNLSFEAENWLAGTVASAYAFADQIMVDSAEANCLKTQYSHSFDDYGSSIPQAEQMTSRYGSFGPITDITARTAQCSPYTAPRMRRIEKTIDEETATSPEADKSTEFHRHSSREERIKSSLQHSYKIPGTTAHTNTFRLMAGRLGLDFLVAGIKFFSRQLDHALESVVGATMSSTGFVTFLDLTSVTCAASTPLTSKPQILDVFVAPEPRDILWENAHVSAKSRSRNEYVVNCFLFIGVFFWIFPLAAIQAFAKAEYVALIPGMEWILTFDGGSVSAFVNGYLPVVALLCLILLLPVVFEFVALKYERRKTYSDVQRSMVGRYFFYQLVNIYITVTAGSLWRSLAEILNHPSNLLQLLGESLPTMVGYFIALLVTKIFAGLPIVFLRVGALSRMLLLRAISSGDRLTQRERDRIYRPENVQYGWEFPSQLLVIVIVFTYAVICPVILPVGLLYFLGSLLVYKKQILYVYQPVYESGGAMFPEAVQRTLYGLVCGQMTLIGYLVTRLFYRQAVFLLPLPAATIWGMDYFHRHYAKPSERLSLERAREYDRVSEVLAARSSKEKVSDDSSSKSSPSPYGIEARRSQFDKNSYKQPVLTQKPMLPRRYRRGHNDDLTFECRAKLQAYALMNDSEEPC